MGQGDLEARVTATTTGMQAAMVQAATVTEAQMRKIAQYLKAANDETARLERQARATSETAREAYDSVAQSAEKMRGAHAGVSRELLVLAHEMSQGNYSRFSGSMLVLAERANLMEFAMSGAGAAALALGGAVVGAMALIAKGAIDEDRFNRSLIETSNYAGLTADSLSAMAKSVAQVTGGTLGNARTALEGLAATGRFGPDVIDQAAQAVVQLERVTGQHSDEIVKDFARMGDGVAKWAEEHNRQYHFLTADQYGYIKALEDSQHSEQAQLAVLEQLTKQFGSVNDKLSEGAKNWQAVKQAASEFFDSVQGVGRTETIGDQIDEIDRRLQRMKTVGRDPFVLNTHGDLAPTQANIDALLEARRTLQRQQTQLQGYAEAKAKSDAVQSAGIAARDDIDALLKKAQATSALTEAMKKYHAEVDAAAKANAALGKPSPYTAAQVRAGEAEIRRQFAHPALRPVVAPPNTPQEDFRTSELKDNDAVLKAMREDALKALEAQNKLLASVHELDTPQQDFRRSELEAQEKVNAALREQQLLQAQLDHTAAHNADVWNGVSDGVKDYLKTAQDSAGQARKVIEDAMKGAEDAIVHAAETGKLTAKSLFASIADDLLHMEVHRDLASLFASLGGVPGNTPGAAPGVSGVGSQLGLIGAVGSALANSNVIGNLLDIFPTFAEGLDYVPYDGFPAVLHEGERVQRRQDVNRERGSGGAVHVDMSGQTIQVGQGVSRAEVFEAVRQGNQATVAQISRLVRTGKVVGA